MTDYRSPTGRYVRWPDLVRSARAEGGRWLFAFANAPASVARDIRQRRSLHLHHADGRLEAQVRNAYENPDTGTEYGDVYVRWSTDTTEENPMPKKERHDFAVSDELFAELGALGAMLGHDETGRRSRAAAEVLREYGEGAARRSEPAPYSPVRLRVFVEPEVWARAVERADAEGISVTAALAEFTRRVLDRERDIQRDGVGLA